MSAINNPKKSEKRSNSKDIAIVGGIIAIGAVLLFAYLMWYVSPEVVQRVKVVAVTEAGCIGETYDGYAVNIGECSVEPGQYTIAPVDEKLKERAAQMNPTN